MNIVGNSKEIISCGILKGYGLAEAILGVLNECGTEVVIVISIQIEVRDDISEGSHITRTTGSI